MLFRLCIYWKKYKEAGRLKQQEANGTTSPTILCPLHTVCAQNLRRRHHTATFPSTHSHPFFKYYRITVPSKWKDFDKLIIYDHISFFCKSKLSQFILSDCRECKYCTSVTNNILKANPILSPSDRSCYLVVFFLCLASSVELLFPGPKI